ncbi:uncharacterized protein At3g27210-like [Humulus lupulus]|uniref:uncharacterized protein At3g27210-like n=1 Tax=Humulus lupulus TaxID=3486 RepID=UPI002B40C3BA|nr:uncharacterized protein At3g27210-like [Humulus lupulus]
MGACASTHRSSDTAMKLRLSFGSKNDKLGIPPSPVKEKPAGGDCLIKDVALKPWSPSPSPLSKTIGDYGSKEEAFFDSQPWLESDCDDDFYSVNGDFTPSRGNTPVHGGFTTGSARVNNKTPFEDRMPGSVTPAPPPTERKKRLLELFQESMRENVEEASNTANGTPEAKQAVGLDIPPPKSGRGTPFVSGANSVCSSEWTPIGEMVIRDEEKPMRSSQCCLPSLISCRSFSDRKKKMSPAIAVNDRP